MSRRNAMLALFAMLLTLGLSVPRAALAHGKDHANGPRPAQYELPGDNVFPEGVAYQRGTAFFYVSSTTDGTIFRGDLREPRASVFLPGGADGRTTAVGLKVDHRGRLFVAGGNTGQVFVYDTATKALLFKASNGLPSSQTFINDVAINSRDGAAYFTDSISPLLYKVAQNAQGQWTFETFLDFTGTPFVYQQGFNANGIAATPNGKYLIVVQSNTGKLFRIDLATKQVAPIDLGGQTVTNGDGILLQGNTLYVVRNALGQIAKVKLANDLRSGTIVGSISDPSFAYPTTIARAQGRLLVVNSQFNKRGPGLTPTLPFTVSSIRVP